MKDNASLITLLEDLRDTLQSSLQRAADSHYDNIIFSPDHPGETPYDKYLRLYGQSEADELQRIEAAIRALEDEMSGPGVPATTAATWMESAIAHIEQAKNLLPEYGFNNTLGHLSKAVQDISLARSAWPDR